MDFLKNLGFDPILLGAQILNFLIIYYLLKRFLYKPVLDMIKKREDKISEGLKQAQDAQEALDKALEQEKKILAKAHSQAKEILGNAHSKALENTREMEENTKLQTEKMIKNAKEAMEEEATVLENKLTQKISLVASDLLTKSLEGMFDEKTQKQIIDKTLKNIKKSN